MKHIKQILAACLICIALFTCANSNAQQQEEFPRDSWYFTPEDDDGEGHWQELKPQRSYRVKPILTPRYIDYLKDVRFKKIGWAEAQTVVGNAMEETEGYQPYLVRGLMINDGTGAFEIYNKGNKIFVSHGSLGKFTSWKRQPLIVILSTPPEEVYTDALTAL